MSKLTSRTPEEERGVPMTHAQCAFGGAPEQTFPFTLLHLNVAIVFWREVESTPPLVIESQKKPGLNRVKSY